MKKLLYLFLLLPSFVTAAVYASTNEKNKGDYHNITVYKLTEKSSEKDSIASYIARSALYNPMDGTVVICGSHYDILSNPSYNISNELSSDFRYIVGNYYTNLD